MYIKTYSLYFVCFCFRRKINTWQALRLCAFNICNLFSYFHYRIFFCPHARGITQRHHRHCRCRRKFSTSLSKLLHLYSSLSYAAFFNQQSQKARKSYAFIISQILFLRQANKKLRTKRFYFFYEAFRPCNYLYSFIFLSLTALLLCAQLPDFLRWRTVLRSSPGR